MVYGIAHLFLGSSLLTAALLTGGPTVVLLWPAAAFGLVGVAAVTGRPQLLGKSPLGRRSPAMTALLLPWIGPVRAWLSASAAMSDETPWSEVADGLFMGRMARFDEMPSGADLVVDLTAELAADPRVIAGRTYVCVPSLDVTALSPDVLQPLIERVAVWPGRVLIHCTQGRERSGLVMAGVLVRRGLAPDMGAAAAQIEAARPGLELAAARAVPTAGGTELPEAI